VLCAGAEQQLGFTSAVFTAPLRGFGKLLLKSSCFLFVLGCASGIRHMFRRLVFCWWAAKNRQKLAAVFLGCSYHADL
jgi:hypothetical protein